MSVVLVIQDVIVESDEDGVILRYKALSPEKVELAHQSLQRLGVEFMKTPAKVEQMTTAKGRV